jgi:hypothetical protein
MNHDWVEKQKAKEAALAQVAQGEAGRTHKKPGPKKGEHCECCCWGELRGAAAGMLQLWYAQGVHI